MKTGLIMEGGAMRGIFTCGVIDVFLEEGVRFDGAAGISAGACFGCNFKSGQIGRALRYNKRFSRDARYCSIRSLVRTGDLYGAEFCYRVLPDRLDPFDRESFAADPMDFYVGATDVDTGGIVYRNCRDGSDEDMQWIRASASMPLVSRIVETGGHRLLDGGIADPVPYRVMERAGYDRNVYILTRPKGYRKAPSLSMPWVKIAMSGTPEMVRAMGERHTVYNRQMAEIDEKERRGEILVIRPPESLGIRRTEHDPGELDRVYRIGRREAEKRLSETRGFISGQ